MRWRSGSRAEARARFWLHFNHAGYQAFGDILARRLPDTTTVDSCSYALAPSGLGNLDRLHDASQRTYRQLARRQRC
jgi:hypothetical protein